MDGAILVVIFFVWLKIAALIATIFWVLRTFLSARARVIIGDSDPSSSQDSESADEGTNELDSLTGVLAYADYPRYLPFGYQDIRLLDWKLSEKRSLRFVSAL